MMLNRMSRLAWNRLAMPRANPRMMLRTPSLVERVSSSRNYSKLIVKGDLSCLRISSHIKCVSYNTSMQNTREIEG